MPRTRTTATARHWDDEDSLGAYEEFVAPLAELFDRTAGVFDCGNLPLAREGYRKLFEVFELEDDFGRGIQATDFRTPTSEARAADTCVPSTKAKRPRIDWSRLFEEMEEFGDLLGNEPIMLEDLIRVSTQPLPDRESFLRAWIAFLRQQGAPADRWLREAVRLLEGTKGLEAFARKEGKRHPHAYLDWLDALQSEGKPAEVVAAGARPSGRCRRIGRSVPPSRTSSATRPDRSTILKPFRKAGGRHSPPGRPSAACSTSGRRDPSLSAGLGCARPSATWTKYLEHQSSQRAGCSTPRWTTAWMLPPGSRGPCSHTPGCSAAIGR